MTEHASADAMMAAAGLTGEFAAGTRPGLTAALAALGPWRRLARMAPADLLKVFANGR